MSQKRRPKWRQHFLKMVNQFLFFCQKPQTSVHFVSYDFVQILPAGGPNTCQIMYGEIVDFQRQRK